MQNNIWPMIFAVAVIVMAFGAMLLLFQHYTRP